MYFDKQEFTVMHKFSAYYASIMLNAFRHLLCSLLCQHNRRVPNNDYKSASEELPLINSIEVSCQILISL